MSKLAVKTVLVAGAEGALGREAVLYFADKGLKVAASCRNSEAAAGVAALVKARGLAGVEVLTSDLSSEAEVSAMTAEAEKRLGSIDGLFSAAGGFRWAKTVDTSFQDFQFLMSANALSAFLLAKHTTPRMLARGFGRMVFVSARTTLAPGEVGMGAYTASKAALNGLIASLASELRQTKVRVNAVLPTIIDTPLNREAMPDADFGSWVSPQALLEVVAMLMSEAGETLNGALLPVAGRL